MNPNSLCKITEEWQKKSKNRDTNIIQVNYEFSTDDNGGTICPTENNCKKNLCECDKFLAEALDNKIELYKAE